MSLLLLLLTSFSVAYDEVDIEAVELLLWHSPVLWPLSYLLRWRFISAIAVPLHLFLSLSISLFPFSIPHITKESLLEFFTSEMYLEDFLCTPTYFLFLSLSLLRSLSLGTCHHLSHFSDRIRNNGRDVEGGLAQDIRKKVKVPLFLSSTPIRIYHCAVAAAGATNSSFAQEAALARRGYARRTNWDEFWEIMRLIPWRAIFLNISFFPFGLATSRPNLLL